MAAKDGKAKTRKTPTPAERNRPAWVDPFLKHIAENMRSFKVAARLVGTTRVNAYTWFNKSKERLALLTRAQERREAQVVDEFIDNMRAHAANGSSWHQNRLLALFAKETLRKVNDVLRETDPDAIHLDLTGDGRPAVTLDELFKLSQNGGFAHRGDGDDTAKD